MARPLALLALTCACAAAAGIGNPLKPIGSIFSKVGTEIQKDVADIKHPIEEGIVYIGSSQCSAVKKIAGVAYDQLDGGKEPDYTNLALVFRNSQVTVSFNLSSAAELIPKTTGFDPTQKLYLYLHGFTDDPSKGSFSNISNALFAKGNINVLALDASSLIKWLYLRSSTYVAFIGRKLGEVLTELVNDGMDPADIHIIGHSLGAHISGFTGKQFTNATGLKVGRISGLDPAGPCFSHVDDDMRLKSSDADFVDVIHSDAGVFGLDYKVGHVDYWPNDGSQQANCFYQTCSHSRSWAYYAESVTNPEAFPAVKCDSWDDFKKGDCTDEISYMGWASEPSASGNYYLRTGNESPFGLGVNGTWYDKSEEGVVRKVAGLFG